jgi:putative transcriptional regulator
VGGISHPLILALINEINILQSKKVNKFAYYAMNMSKKAINRIKVVLAEKNLSSKWLAEQLGKNEATISRWCTNEVQPPVKTFVQIAAKLNVTLTSLFND